MQTEPTKAEPPKRQRRWYQFSLRSFPLDVKTPSAALITLLSILGCNSRYDVPARVKSGIAHLGTGEFDEAIADYTVAIRLNPNDAPAFFGRGVAHGDKGELDAAIQDDTEATLKAVSEST
jgi:tetratricopeptide (TPR) repeat protein